MRRPPWVLVAGALLVAACCSTAPPPHPAPMTSASSAIPTTATDPDVDIQLMKVAPSEEWTWVGKTASGGTTTWKSHIRTFSCPANLSHLPLRNPVPDRPGKIRCVLAAVHENTGKLPGSPDPFGALVTDHGLFAQNGDDDTVSDDIAEAQPDSNYYAGDANPGDEQVTYTAWSLPPGVRPRAVQFPMQTISSGPQFEVALP